MARAGQRLLNSRLTGPAPRRLPVAREFTAAVESLTGTELVGWVEVPRRTGPVDVGLYLNDLKIGAIAPTRTKSRSGQGELRWFRFRLRDVWHYCGPEDRLQVRLNGWPVPMNRRGSFYRPVNQGKRPLAELRARLANGWVFASNGVLNKAKTLDLDWQDQVLGLYHRVRAALEDICGYECFLIYGSLLGAVRERGFIGHDFDLDAAYLSRHQAPTDVAAELVEIASALMSRGFHIDCHLTSLHIRDDLAGTERIDLFHLYFDREGKLRFPWGVAGTQPFVRSQWTGIIETKFARTVALVPEQAEELVETIYGPNWRIPNAGFTWERDRTEAAPEASLSVATVAAVNWEDYYVRAEPAEPSGFFQAVSAERTMPTTIVDLGCGDGRDSIAFAAAGRRVLGLDLSEAGLDHARARAVGSGADVELRFEHCNLDQPGAVHHALVGMLRADEPVLFYGRFLLHALFEETQQNVLNVIKDVSRPGDVLALEFRGLEDANRPKRYRQRYRRFVDGSEVAARLVEHGYVLHHEQGTGFAPYGDVEDPWVHRIIARRGDT